MKKRLRCNKRSAYGILRIVADYTHPKDVARIAATCKEIKALVGLEFTSALKKGLLESLIDNAMTTLLAALTKSIDDMDKMTAIQVGSVRITSGIVNNIAFVPHGQFSHVTRLTIVPERLITFDNNFGIRKSFKDLASFGEWMHDNKWELAERDGVPEVETKKW
jgi:hypothetical protein